MSDLRCQQEYIIILGTYEIIKTFDFTTEEMCIRAYPEKNKILAKFPQVRQKIGLRSGFRGASKDYIKKIILIE